MSPTPAPVTAQVEVRATPDEVWDVVSDLARMPEFSPELVRAHVLGRPGVGARVVGVNRRGVVVWPTLSRVVRWEPARAVAWKTRESGATWVYELAASATGTSVTARRVLPRFTAATALMGPFIGGAAGHDAELAAGLRTTLERVKDAVERAHAPA